MILNKHIFSVFIVVLFSQHCLFSQNNDITIKEFFIDGVDTIPISEIPSIEIISFKDPKEKIRYQILKRKVLKVYPYAIYTAKKLEEIEVDIGLLKRKRKKKYTKEVARFLKEEFGQELKKLTRTEGNILVKLIYRETKISTYKLLKQYRGSMNAFFWQSMAKIYDNDLKQEYDPVNNREDMFIEHIIINAKLEGRIEEG